jgi:hypothetical protein
MGLVDFTCQKTSQQQVNMMTIIIIMMFFFFFVFFLFDRSFTGTNLVPTSSTNSKSFEIYFLRKQFSPDTSKETS